MATTASDRLGHRRRVLSALGVTDYRQCHQFGPDRRVQPAAVSARIEGATDGATTCVLVLPHACDARQRKLLDRIVAALGPAFVYAPHVDVVAGKLAGPPPAAAVYLAFGAEQQQAISRNLPAHARAEVLLLDAPDVLFEAAGKRRLWQAVRGLRCRPAQSDAEA